MLLREMQHRVKNNLQFVIAAIGQQRRRLPTPEVRRALDHVAARVHAVALAHAQLNPATGFDTIDLAGYLTALCANVEQQLDHVQIDVHADPITLLLDRAVSLGLIVNELITNSAKHAFGPDGGRVTVTVTAGVGVGEARLAVADNGKGMESAAAEGTGYRLIASLATQISKAGTTVSLTFPVVA
jgi:two-component system, sensor histidine kinase PdtaS